MKPDIEIARETPLKKIDEVHPDPAIRETLEQGYAVWRNELQSRLKLTNE